MSRWILAKARLLFISLVYNHVLLYAKSVLYFIYLLPFCVILLCRVKWILLHVQIGVFKSGLGCSWKHENGLSAEIFIIGWEREKYSPEGNKTFNEITFFPKLKGIIIQILFFLRFIQTERVRERERERVLITWKNILHCSN